jgi:hypothetical protein
MTTNPKLRLPVAPETAIFRLVDRMLRADETLFRVVKTWRSYQGGPDDRTDLAEGHCPFVRLSTRNGGGERFFSPSGTEGQIEIVVELGASGSCLDDIHNLWGAVKRALFPTDATARLAFQSRLRDAGARTGLIEVAQSAFDPTPGTDGVMYARGVLSCTYRFDTALTSCDT